MTLAWVMKESNPESPASASTRECVRAGLRRSSKDSFHCQIMSPVEVSSSFLDSVGEALLPPPEVPDSLPESLRGQPVVLLHDLTELLPGPSFYLCHSTGRGMLELTVPVSHLRSPTSQPQPIGLLLQLDSISYCWCTLANPNTRQLSWGATSKPTPARRLSPWATPE
ncbi:hypothetical protein ATANTOWER_014318 [Ataeniobius toweri]|uniref:Uncharacterized protein n=1 Tax=Ataeniobius toweri TaxID=208326 RepID=A0ABU7C094_9TELE|nr:hypothetical protein [Ataeniobius toweri]